MPLPFLSPYHFYTWPHKKFDCWKYTYFSSSPKLFLSTLDSSNHVIRNLSRILHLHAGCGRTYTFDSTCTCTWELFWPQVYNHSWPATPGSTCKCKTIFRRRNSGLVSTRWQVCVFDVSDPHIRQIFCTQFRALAQRYAVLSIRRYGECLGM